MQTSFGSGRLIVTPLSDAYGNVIVTPTPRQIGILQNVSLDFGRDIKELHGQGSYAIDIGGGKAKFSGKCSAAKISAQHFNDLYVGQTVTTGKDSIRLDTTGSDIPATPGPYTITPTVPESGTWAADLGVDDANGQPMTRVTGTPATGQYAVSAGTYTFAAADQGQKVFITFRYSVAGSGKTLDIANVDMGEVPTFRAELLTRKNGKAFYVCVYNFVSGKLGLETKQDDFLVPGYEFTGFADSLGRVARICTQE